MSFEDAGREALEYHKCRYGTARLDFRGPQRPLTGAYSLCLGGTETFGKFVAEPYSTLLEQELAVPVVNLGVVNGGLDPILAELDLLDMADRAQTVVVQITGAQALNNRFYAVHPRRNDRFLRATATLRLLYPDLDLTDIAFTGHLLRVLNEASPAVFKSVADELRRTWIRRTTLLLKRIKAPTVLLWIGTNPPPEMPETLPNTRNPGRPPLVDARMIDAVAPYADRYVEVVASSDAQSAGTQGMTFEGPERRAAQTLPGPQLHREVAARLAPVLRDLAIRPETPEALRA